MQHKVVPELETLLSFQRDERTNVKVSYLMRNFVPAYETKAISNHSYDPELQCQRCNSLQRNQ
jgi:hypothetical protein